MLQDGRMRDRNTAADSNFVFLSNLIQRIFRQGRVLTYELDLSVMSRLRASLTYVGLYM